MLQTQTAGEIRSQHARTHALDRESQRLTDGSVVDRNADGDAPDLSEERIARRDAAGRARSDSVPPVMRES